MPLTYPTPAEYLYTLLREVTDDDLAARFVRWNLSHREARSLLALRPVARRLDSAAFVEQVLGLVRRAPDDYPPVLRPRPPAVDLEEKKQRYGALLKGKRVALVGPSESIVGSGQGHSLEAHDLIVRLNFQWPVPPPLVTDVGRRMDVLYHCCNGDVSIAQLFRPGFEDTKFVCWQLGLDSDRLQEHCARTGVADMEVSSVYEDILQQTHAFPTTGTVALCHLLSHDVERLYVTGMTFFRDRHYEGYQTGGGQAVQEFRRGQSDAVGIHNVAAQFELVRRLQANDPRLTVDATLGALLTDG